MKRNIRLPAFFRELWKMVALSDFGILKTSVKYVFLRMLFFFIKSREDKEKLRADQAQIGLVPKVIHLKLLSVS